MGSSFSFPLYDEKEKQDKQILETQKLDRIQVLKKSVEDKRQLAIQTDAIEQMYIDKKWDVSDLIDLDKLILAELINKLKKNSKRGFVRSFDTRVIDLTRWRRSVIKLYSSETFKKQLEQSFDTAVFDEIRVEERFNWICVKTTQDGKVSVVVRHIQK